MNSFTLLMTLLPVFFMIHDFEEIIFFPSWIKKNKSFLTDRFPVLSRPFLPHIEKMSATAFTVAVSVMFLLICILTYLSVCLEFPYLWLAAFMGFFIHLFLHIAQWIILRRYVPVIVTSFLALPYCICTFSIILQEKLFSVSEIIICTVAGLLILLPVIVSAHKFGVKADEWING